MTHARTLLAAFVTGCVLAAPGLPALAKSPIAEVLCEPTGQLYDRLTRRMARERSASGIRDREQVMELWTNRHGDWTLVATYAGGTSCILAMGEAWENLSPRGREDRERARSAKPEG